LPDFFATRQAPIANWSMKLEAKIGLGVTKETAFKQRWSFC
jgi:hypothetical protein